MPHVLSFSTVKPWIHGNFTSYAAVSSSYVDDDSNPQSLIHDAYLVLQTFPTTTQKPTITSSYSSVKSTSSSIAKHITPTKINTTPALTTSSSFSSSISTPSTTAKIAITSYAVVWMPDLDSTSSPNVPSTSLSTTRNSQAAPPPLAASNIYLASSSTFTTVTTTPPTHFPITAALIPNPIILPVTTTPSTGDSLIIPPSADPDPMSHIGTNPCTSSSSSFTTSLPILLLLATLYLAISSTIGFIRVCMRKLYPETYPRVGPQGEMSGREVRKLFWEGFLWPVWPCVLVRKGRWGRIEFKKSISSNSLEKGKGKEICV
ncbi:hypothetical protein QBC43DRAFT_286230 [Cladorrhinum sp. PSN259]|nr:hypothetical protein QBC43DRAFT_286230 [Cladorrhinum sp. PSN259]